jgi:RNA polymerase sigma-70 factor, ECF subfamily
MTSPSDGQLLRAFRAGETSAFTELVNRHQATLLRHARALLGPGSSYEDVVQEVFLKLAQSPPEPPTDAEGDEHLERVQLLSWLHKVTRNSCMDVMRAEKRRKRREEDVAPNEGHGGGLETVEARDTRAVVERELEKLPVDQREVLVLRLLGDRSYKEIAEITGKKIGTVGWLVSVGLKTLSQELAPLFDGARAGLGGAREELDGADSRLESTSTDGRQVERDPRTSLDLVQGELS